MVGQILMHHFTALAPEPRLFEEVEPANILENSLVLDLDNFPELQWLSLYLKRLAWLHSQRDQINDAIRAIAREGEIYRSEWIEPYTKTKGGKSYTYHQLRWLTGDRRPSGQPRVKTKHLSHKQVGEARAAIARGHQAKALEKQRQRINEEISALRELVRETDRALQQQIYQNF